MNVNKFIALTVLIIVTADVAYCISESKDNLGDDAGRIGHSASAAAGGSGPDHLAVTPEEQTEQTEQTEQRRLIAEGRAMSRC